MSKQDMNYFKVGDLVHVTWGPGAGLNGRVTYIGAGPKGNKVAVELDHPVHSMMGPAILDPKNLKLVARPGAPFGREFNRAGESKLIFGRKDAHKAEILQGMARALFVSTWANYEEERGRHHQGDLMDAAPATPSPARSAAKILAKKIQEKNGKSISDLYADALNAGGRDDARTFGHYLAMQSLGHGVSWFDDNPEFPLELPYFEFAKTSAKHYYYPRA